MTQTIYKAFLCILCLGVLAGGVQALSITAGPDQIQEGGQITVTIQGLEDDSSFCMHIGAEIAPEDNHEFAFSSNNLNMPFTLTDTTVTLQGESVVWAKFRYQQDAESPTKSIGFGSDDNPVPNGIIKDEESFGQISEGSEIAMLEITGKAVDDTETVSVSFELDGIKSGDDDASISYTVNDMDQGTVSIIVSVDGAEALNKKIQVGDALPTAVPTKRPSGGDDDDDYVPNPTTTPDTGLSAASSDGHATLTVPLNTITGAEADDIIIIKNSHPKDIPDTWQLIYGAYIIAPESLGFSEPAELAITGGEGLKTTTSFIAEYDGETWNMLPTVLRGDALVADISESGSYALMAFGTSDISSEPTAQETAGTTSAPTVTPASQATSTPTPTTSGLPGFVGIVMALGAFMVALRLNK